MPLTTDGPQAELLRDARGKGLSLTGGGLVTAAPGPAAGRRTLGQVAVLLIVGTLWGIQPALIKFSLGGALGEIETLAILMVAVALSLGLYLKSRGKLFPVTRGIAAFMAIGGFLEYAAPLLTTFLVAPHVDAALLTLIIAMTPVFTVAFAAVAGVEQLTRRSVLACLTGLVAMALIVVPEGALPSREMLPWCLAAFMIPVFYSCGTIYVSRNWPEGFDSIQVAFCGATAAALMLSPFWIKPILSGAVAGHPFSGYVVMAVLAAALTLELLLYFYLLHSTGPVFTSFSSFVMIISGFLAGMAIFGERPSVWIWTSVALFILSLLMVFWPQSRRLNEPAGSAAAAE